jgi:hypothetical protein
MHSVGRMQRFLKRVVVESVQLHSVSGICRPGYTKYSLPGNSKPLQYFIHFVSVFVRGN